MQWRYPKITKRLKYIWFLDKIRCSPIKSFTINKWIKVSSNSLNMILIAAKKTVTKKFQVDIHRNNPSTTRNKSIRKSNKCNLKIFILKEILCRCYSFFKRIIKEKSNKSKFQEGNNLWINPQCFSKNCQRKGCQKWIWMN